MNTNRVRKIDPATVSARLVCLREWLGLTQQQMAGMLRMPPRTYRTWECPGRRLWHGGGFLEKLVTATGVSGAWVLTGSYHLEPPSPAPLAADGLPLPRSAGIRITDPGEIAFLEQVQQMPSEERARMETLLNAIVQRQPAPVLRAAAIDYFRASGVPERQAGGSVDKLMRDFNDLHTSMVAGENRSGSDGVRLE